MNEQDEIEAVRASIAAGENDIAQAQAALDNLIRKQLARKKELGFQEARALFKASAYSSDPIPGVTPIVVQTGFGVATRWKIPAKKETATP